jgi:hypothetical protein
MGRPVVYWGSEYNRHERAMCSWTRSSLGLRS